MAEARRGPRVRVPSAPPIHVSPRSPSDGVRACLRRVFRHLESRLAVLMDGRPWTWVHGQNTANDTSSRPGLVGLMTGDSSSSSDQFSAVLRTARRLFLKHRPIPRSLSPPGARRRTAVPE
jgi:hypothetical protein